MWVVGVPVWWKAGLRAVGGPLGPQGNAKVGGNEVEGGTDGGAMAGLAGMTVQVRGGVRRLGAGGLAPPPVNGCAKAGGGKLGDGGCVGGSMWVVGAKV